MKSSDILVVGAGPTGLMTAAALARCGLRAGIIDRRDAPSIHSRALAIQPRSMEIFEALGLRDELLARGRRLQRIQAHAGRRELVTLSLADLDSPFPYILVVPQSDTERVLEAHLRTLGVEVERGRTLRHFEADGGGVQCTVTDAAGAHDAIEARWLVGCDGAHSLVRTRLGVGWRGEDIPGVFVLADVRADGNAPAGRGGVWLSGQGALVVLPLVDEGCYRIIAAMPPDTDAPDPPPLAFLQHLVDERATGLELRLRDATWRSRFEVHQRKVDTWRVGRVLLAGDAAHCHSPVGGQGMNTGLQDAWNLAWKLALVSQGQGRGILLDAYEAERDPVIEELLHGTALGTRMVTLRNPLTRLVRDQAVRLLGGLDFVQRRVARNVSETAVHYRDSPIVSEYRSALFAPRLPGRDDPEAATLVERRAFGAAPAPGDRAPDVTFGRHTHRRRLFELLDYAHHTLLLFDGRPATATGYLGLSNVAQDVVARYGQRVKPHIVVPAGTEPHDLVWRDDTLLDPDHALHDRYGAAAECLYLIRPDGHIAFRSQPVDADALFAYLEQIFP